MAAAAVGVALALPAPALATTVSVITVEVVGDTVSIVDGTGVTDTLVADGGRISGVTVTSLGGAPITAGSRCTQTSATVVSCPPANLLSATLANGADALTDRTNLLDSFDGGPGGDRMIAGRGGGSVRGGDGNDILLNAASPLEDGIVRTLTLRGEDGNDRIDLSGNRSGRDTAHGGAGVDTVSYAARLDARVEVALDDIANDGAFPPLTPPGGQPLPNEQDNVRSDVEDLEGGGRNDLLTGSARSNQLSGMAGSDTLRGLAGSDVLLGGAGDDVERGGDGNDRVGALEAADAAAQDPGRDTLLGEAGFDTLHAADGESEARIDCGPGELPLIGELATIDLPDPQPIACEVVQRGFRDQHPLVQVRPGSGRVRGGRVAVGLACPRAAPGRRCAGTVRVVTRGRTLARGRYRIRKGRGRTVQLRLRRPVRGVAQVLTLESDTQGRPETTRTRIRLRG